MKAHIEKTREALGDLEGLSRQTSLDERRILKNAKKRLAEVESAIARLGAGIDTAPEKEQQRYLDFTEEKGRLQRVIERARISLKS